MVQSSKEALGTIQLEEVHEKSMTFAHEVNERLVELELDGHFAMDSELKTSRVARKKQMPGEEAPDSTPDSPLQRFRVEVFRRIIDQICTSFTERFSVNQDLIKNKHVWTQADSKSCWIMEYQEKPLRKYQN